MKEHLKNKNRNLKKRSYFGKTISPRPCLEIKIIGLLIGLFISAQISGYFLRHETKDKILLSPVAMYDSKSVPIESFEQRRIRQLNTYLQRFQTPLKKDVPSIVMFGVSNRIDPALIVAVARKESTLCVRSRGFNCFGIGGASGLWSFESYLDGVETFAELVSTAKAYESFRATNDYYDLAVRYCPPFNNKGEPECDTKGWAKEVEGYVKEIESI